MVVLSLRPAGLSTFPTVHNPSLTLTMPLAAHAGTRLGSVNATAEAGAEPLSYRLVHGSSAFSVNETSGEIVLHTRLTVASSIVLTVAGEHMCVRF